MRALLFLSLLWLASQIMTTFNRPVSGHAKPSPHQVNAIVSRWPGHSQEMVHHLIDRYGLPETLDHDVLRWQPSGDCAIEVYRTNESGVAAVIPESASPKNN